MNTRIALVLLSALGATATLPATATITAAAERRETRLDWDADNVLRRLQAMGIDATSVEEWNGLVRAYVRIGNGEVMQYFDARTLARVDV